MTGRVLRGKPLLLDVWGQAFPVHFPPRLEIRHQAFLRRNRVIRPPMIHSTTIISPSGVKQAL
jgi:hypothetical protein